MRTGCLMQPSVSQWLVIVVEKSYMILLVNSGEVDMQSDGKVATQGERDTLCLYR